MNLEAWSLISDRERYNKQSRSYKIWYCLTAINIWNISISKRKVKARNTRRLQLIEVDLCSGNLWAIIGYLTWDQRLNQEISGDREVDGSVKQLSHYKIAHTGPRLVVPCRNNWLWSNPCSISRSIDYRYLLSCIIAPLNSIAPYTHRLLEGLRGII